VFEWVVSHGCPYDEDYSMNSEIEESDSDNDDDESEDQLEDDWEEDDMERKGFLLEMIMMIARMNLKMARKGMTLRKTMLMKMIMKAEMNLA
jgi:hypothetical protein